MTEGIEWFKEGETVLALIVRASVMPAQTTFFTPDSFYQQAGFVVYPAGGTIHAHDHKPIQRHLVGTAETLLIRKGKAVAHIYDSHRNPVGDTVLETGDMIMLVSGGHGFTLLEDTVFLEIKQGPYTGLVEKERFE